MENKLPYRIHPKGKHCIPLFEYLVDYGLDIQCERGFDWLFYPTAGERLPTEDRVASALREHCTATRNSYLKKSFCDPDMLLDDTVLSGRRRKLEFDFFLPRLNIAIEFDERQHFTAERAVSLAHYGDTVCHFDVERWRAGCSPNIRDADPPCRDWERAFRDAVRDIRAAEAGIKLYRVCYKDASGDRIAAALENVLT